MLLVIDIGNTNIVMGVYREGQLRAHWRLSSTITRTSDESYIFLKLLFETTQLEIQAIQGIIISSVVPNLTGVFMRMSTQYFGRPALVVDSTLDTGIKILFKTPETVGADRICNAVGGYVKYGGPLIIVDFGTATTFDVVTKDAEYLGGIIVPGIEMSAASLHLKTAQLPRVTLQFPENLIGQTTPTSIQSGLMYGGVAMVDGLIQRIVAERQESMQVIATGGLASVLQAKSEQLKIVEPFLTLDGLFYIYNRIKA